MPTTPKSSWRYPASSASPNVPQDIQNLATDLDWIGPNYASSSLRNSANPTPSVGDTCRVAGFPQVYVAGAWFQYGFDNCSTTLQYSPGATQSTPTSGSAVWINPGNITVPPWATTVDVTWSVNGFTLATAGTTATSVQLKIGSAAGVGGRRLNSQLTSGQRDSNFFTDTITGLTVGTQLVSVTAMFGGGTAAAFQMDTASHFSAFFNFS